MKSRFLVFFLFIVMAGPVYGSIAADTLKWVDFKELVLRNHPVMIKYQLVEERAKSRMRQAWGNFEPGLSYNYDQKLFDGLNYYRFSSQEVTLPLWFGMELKGNFAEASGYNLNPENKIPGEGLSNAGISLPLGKGLLMDKRRAALKQAMIFKDATQTEQLRILNDLMLQAGDAYAEWQSWHKISQLYEQALELAQIRFKGVKDGFLGGDMPAIDTVEALTQLQQRLISLQDRKLQQLTSLYELSTYLWRSESEPFDPDKLVFIPQEDNVRLPEVRVEAVDNNPKLKAYDFKLQDLNIDKRLKAENLRPTIDLQLGLLNSGTGVFRNFNPVFWQNNNKVSLNVAFPLTFASARGELAEAKIKITETQIEQSLVRNELEVKLRQNRAELSTLQSQLALVNQSLQANQKLLEGESMRFSLGESSLFLINARESKLLEIQEKMIETEYKILKTHLKARWLTGGDAY